MQYQVPQFIEVEDKIFGPLTFRQFVYLVGGGAFCYLLIRFIPFPFSIIFVIPVGGFACALAFYKINNKPFIQVVESAVKFFLQGKLYIWKKENKKVAPEAKKEGELVPKVFVPKLSESKLRDLTWSLDVHETIYSKEAGLTNRETNKEILEKENNLYAFKGLSSDIIKEN